MLSLSSYIFELNMASYGQAWGMSTNQKGNNNIHLSLNRCYKLAVLLSVQIYQNDFKQRQGPKPVVRLIIIEVALKGA